MCSSYHCGSSNGTYRVAIKNEKHRIMIFQFADSYCSWIVDDWKHVKWTESRDSILIMLIGEWNRVRRFRERIVVPERWRCATTQILGCEHRASLQQPIFFWSCFIRRAFPFQHCKGILALTVTITTGILHKFSCQSLYWSYLPQIYLAPH